MNSEAKNSQPVRIALTGGIGSGKSTALTMFAGRQAAVLNSDHVVHKLLQRRDVREMIARQLGVGMFPAGEAGRRMLAHIVFGDAERLGKLEAIMFPLVREFVESWLDTDKVKAAPLAVVELPMLFEADMQDVFDYVLLITAPAEVRQARHAGRITRADFENRAAHQMPEAEKRARADLVYENTGSPEELDEFIAATVAAISGDSVGAPAGEDRD